MAVIGTTGLRRIFTVQTMTDVVQAAAITAAALLIAYLGTLLLMR